MRKIFIIATEASADMLGGKLLSAFAAHKSDVRFFGVGGDSMCRNKNFKKLFDIRLFSVMGLVEVLKNLRALTRSIAAIEQAIKTVKPYAILTIDGSSLAVRIVKKIKAQSKNGALGFACPKFIHYVAPQVWAWKESRAKTFANLFDKILCFFDFEPKYFTRQNAKIKCPVIGYAAIENLRGNKKEFLKKYPHARGKKIIAILPGSRKNEIDSILKTYWQVARKIHGENPDTIFFIPAVSFLKAKIAQATSAWDAPYRPTIIPSEHRHDLFAATYMALSVSGTVVSEISFFGIPAIVSYKFNRLTAAIIRLFIKVKYASVINIVNDRMIQKELIQENATPEKIFSAAQKLLSDKTAYQKAKTEIKNGMKKFGALKSSDAPSEIAYKEIMISLCE